MYILRQQVLPRAAACVIYEYSLIAGTVALNDGDSRMVFMYNVESCVTIRPVTDIPRCVNSTVCYRRITDRSMESDITAVLSRP